MTPSAFTKLYAQATQDHPPGKHDCEPALRLIFVEEMPARQAALKTGVPFSAVTTNINLMHKAQRQQVQQAATA